MKKIYFLIVFCFFSLGLYAQTDIANDSINVLRYKQVTNKLLFENKRDSFFLMVNKMTDIAKKHKSKNAFFNQIYFFSRITKVSTLNNFKSEKALAEALVLHKEVVDNKENDEYYLGTSLTLSQIYLRLEKHEQALKIAQDAYKKCYPEYEKRKVKSFSFTNSMVAILEAQGNTFTRLNANYNAIDSYQKAISMCGNLYTSKTKFKRTLMNNYNNVAIAYDAIGEKELAKRYYFLTDSILEYVPEKNRNQGYYTYKSKLYSNIGSLYSDKNKALEYQEKCLAFGKKAFSENDFEWIVEYIKYSTVLKKFNRTEDALTNLEKALKILVSNKKRHTYYGSIYFSYAYIHYKDKKNSEIALKYLQKSMAYSIDSTANVLDSLDVFKNPNIADKIENIANMMQCLHLKAQIFENSTNEKYQKYTAETYQLLEDMIDKYQFQGYFSGKDELEYRKNNTFYMNNAFLYHLKKGNKEKVFNLSEKIKYYITYEKIKKQNKDLLNVLSLEQIQKKLK